MSKALKLKVVDLQDVMVFAPLLQDSILRLRDVTFLKQEGRFAAVVNRFRWEDVSEEEREAMQASASSADGDAAFEDVDPADNGLARQHMGLCFENVTAVASKNLPSDKDAFLTLLTVTAKADEATLHFAGDAAIRVSYRKLALFGEDLGESWPTFYLPDHAYDGDDSDEGVPGNG